MPQINPNLDTSGLNPEELAELESWPQDQQSEETSNISCSLEVTAYKDDHKWLEIPKSSDEIKGNTLPPLEFLLNNPELNAAIAENEMDGCIWVRGKLPWEKRKTTRKWKKIDTACILSLAEQNLKHSVSENGMMHALEVIAHMNVFNPVREKLEALPPWDGTKRVGNLLEWYLGAEPTKYNQMVETIMINAMIMRTYHPGTKFDTVPILIGSQGIGKSTFCRFLALEDSFFTDELGDIKKRDAGINIAARWVVEIAELAALNNSEIEAIKKFLSKTSDDYRPMYAKQTEQYPRRCIFVGTTNSTSFLLDPTGNRRFLPVKCGEKDAPKNLFDHQARNDFEQALAEALNNYQNSNEKLPLLLPEELAQTTSEMQEEATVEDTDKGVIIAYLETIEKGDRVCTRKVAEDALDIENPKRRETNKIRQILDESPNWKFIGKQRNGNYGIVQSWQRE